MPWSDAATASLIAPLVETLQQNPAVFGVCLFILGACIGSFLNVVIFRLPVMMERDWRAECREYLALPEEPDDNADLTLSTPRSRCGHCGHRITLLENIPVISYLVLGGKCSACKTSLSLQYPLVELFTAVISVIVGLHFGVTWQTLAALFLSWSLIAASGIDVSHQLLPDSITLPLLWLGILLSFFNIFVDLESSVIGAMAGYMSLWSVFMLFKLLTGKEGMGYGDFKLLAMLGAWTGWKMLFAIILTSSVVGAVVGITLILLKKRDRSTQIPFGPYLAAAGWLVLLWGTNMMEFYLSLL